MKNLIAPMGNWQKIFFMKEGEVRRIIGRNDSALQLVPDEAFM